MIVVLESSAISKVYDKNADYLALSRLAGKNVIEVYVPHIVKREIETQRIDDFVTEVNKTLASLKKLKKKVNSQIIENAFSSMNDSKEQLIEDVKLKTDNYFANLNSKFHKLNEKQALEAFEAYFNGTVPLTAPKNRMDIPDSFVCREIEDIQYNSNEEKIILIANDSKIVNTFKDNANYEVYQTIESFIKTSEIQIELSKIDSLEEIENDPTKFITQYEHSTEHIRDCLVDKIGEYLVGKTIKDGRIPDDNGEGQVSSYDSANDIRLDFDSIVSYGDNQYGLYFTARLWVYIDFFVFKSDYHSNDYDFGIEDWNDHYYFAQDEFQLEVEGRVSIKFDLTPEIIAEALQYSDDEFEDYLNDIYMQSTVEVESIDETYIIS